MLHADAGLAARIEHSVTRDLERYASVCARLDESLHVATAHLAGGVAVFIAPGSPVNMLFGAGFEGPVAPDDLDAVERFYAERNASAAISLSPLADPSLVAQLGARGWVLADFENVLARSVVGGPDVLGLPGPASGIEVRVAESPEDRAAWARISAEGSASSEQPSREVQRLAEVGAAREDMTLLIGSADGQDAGASALWIDGELGWMLGDATWPDLRGRGVQSAMLVERTRLAASQGCELVVTEARPGSTSQRNMERLGYSILYTRAEMIARPLLHAE
jgi:GNAT superfamily N-acetyltransferase